MLRCPLPIRHILYKGFQEYVWSAMHLTMMPLYYSYYIQYKGFLNIA